MTRTMRKRSREMDAAWALEVMDKAPYMTVSMADTDGEAYAVPLSVSVTGLGSDILTRCFFCASCTTV